MTATTGMASQAWNPRNWEILCGLLISLVGIFSKFHVRWNSLKSRWIMAMEITVQDKLGLKEKSQDFSTTIDRQLDTCFTSIFLLSHENLGSWNRALNPDTHRSATPAYTEALLQQSRWWERTPKSCPMASTSMPYQVCPCTFTNTLFYTVITIIIEVLDGTWGRLWKRGCLFISPYTCTHVPV